MTKTNIKISFGELRDLYVNLLAVANKKLPIRLSHVISKNMQMISEEVHLIDDCRIKMAENYADKDENGEPKFNDDKYVISDENAMKFNVELNEYYSTTTEIDIYKISADELNKLDEQRYDALSPSEIGTLMFMLDEESDTN